MAVLIETCKLTAIANCHPASLIDGPMLWDSSRRQAESTVGARPSSQANPLTGLK